MNDEGKKEEITETDMSPASGEPGAGTPISGGGSDADAPRKGSFKQALGNKNVWIGIGIGVLVLLLIGGIFAVGFGVGRHSDRIRGVFREDMHYDDVYRHGVEDGRTSMRMRGCWPGVTGEYFDEIEEVAAGTLGLSTEDLQNELNSGRTLAAIAEEKGVSNDDLAKAIAGKINEIADELVAEGKMSSDQAEDIKANSEESALNLIEAGCYGMRMKGFGRGF